LTIKIKKKFELFQNIDNMDVISVQLNSVVFSIQQMEEKSLSLNYEITRLQFHSETSSEERCEYLVSLYEDLRKEIRVAEILERNLRFVLENQVPM
jgi:hypothetical protein